MMVHTTAKSGKRRSSCIITHTLHNCKQNLMRTRLLSTPPRTLLCLKKEVPHHITLYSINMTYCFHEKQHFKVSAPEDNGHATDGSTVEVKEGPIGGANELAIAAIISSPWVLFPVSWPHPSLLGHRAPGITSLSAAQHPSDTHRRTKVVCSRMQSYTIVCA